MENSISDEHASIDVAVAPENGFVDEAIEIFTEWSECQHCSPMVISSVDWRRQVCDPNDRDFLEGMYLVAGAKLCNMNICERHIGLLASKLYLVDAPVVFLRVRIESLWEHRYNMTLLISFIDNHEYWFRDEYPFA